MRNFGFVKKVVAVILSSAVFIFIAEKVHTDYHGFGVGLIITTQPPQSTTVEEQTMEEMVTYGEQTEAQSYRTTVRQTYRTTKRVVRTTASYNDGGCLDDPLTY